MKTTVTRKAIFTNFGRYFGVERGSGVLNYILWLALAAGSVIYLLGGFKQGNSGTTTQTVAGISTSFRAPFTRWLLRATTRVSP